MNKNKKLLLSVLLLVGIVVGVTLSAGLHYWNTEEAVEDETAESGNITEEAQEDADETPHGSTRLGVNRGGVTVSGKSDTRELTEEEKEKYPQLTNIPTLYIQLENNKSIHRIKHDEWMNATYTLVDGDEGIVEQPK